MLVTEIDIVPLIPELHDTYIRIGIRSYRQHYLHLWENRDPTHYIENSFSRVVVQQESKDPNVSLYLIYSETTPIGILKLILDKSLNLPGPVSCLFLERIYLLAEYSGGGIGTRVLQFAESIARANNTEALCLETMQKGPALHFYRKNGYAIWDKKHLEYPGMIETERPMYILGKFLKKE